MGRTASRRALTRTRLRAAGDYGFDPMGLASKPEALFWYAHRLQPGCLAAASLRAPLRQSSPLSELWRWAACSGRPVLRARILHWIKITSVPYQVPRSGGRPRAVGHAWRCWRAGSGLRLTFLCLSFFSFCDVTTPGLRSPSSRRTSSGIHRRWITRRRRAPLTWALCLRCSSCSCTGLRFAAGRHGTRTARPERRRDALRLTQ